MRTYINAGLIEHLSSRYDSNHLPRMAVLPFNVPETFAPPGNESLHFGRELAGMFHREFVKTGELSIVELFNRDRWPGKRAEFHTGNHSAISLARAAGFDLIMVGFMEELRNDTDITVYTRVIDTSNSTTLWYSKTMVYSTARPHQRAMADFGFDKEQPERFYFEERAERLAVCTVERIMDEDVVYPKDEFEDRERGIRPTRGPRVPMP